MKLFLNLWIIFILTGGSNFLYGQLNCNGVLKMKQDCFILTNEPITPYPNHPDIASISWTKGGIPLVVRSLLQFDFSEIPSDATISSAFLDLKGWNSSSNGTSNNADGTNESIFYRVAEAWNDSTCVWNNQPRFDDQKEIQVLANCDRVTDFLNIDFTEYVKEAFANKDSDYGLILKLKYENSYRRMVFASSENDDINLRPVLQINYFTTQDTCYKRQNPVIPEGELRLKNNITINGEISVINSGNYDGNYLLFDMSGKLIHQGILEKLLFTLKSVYNLPAGQYIIKFVTPLFQKTEKFIIQY